MICNVKNAKNYATFVEGCWPDFYARGRFLKYSMSVPLGHVKVGAGLKLRQAMLVTI